jgi:uncharacterized protein (DUF983 family)
MIRDQGNFAMRKVEQAVSLPKALWRGFTGHCPNCSEDFTPQRADDFPAYLVIVVVGHITIPAVLIVEEAFAPPMWLQYLIWLPFIAISALALLQPTKGAVVALQWQLGMHDFADSKKRRDFTRNLPRKSAAETDTKPLSRSAVSA